MRRCKCGYILKDNETRFMFKHFFIYDSFFNSTLAIFAFIPIHWTHVSKIIS